MSSARPRVALVGVGRFGANHLRVLQTLHRARRIEFAGVVGRNPRRAGEIARQFGIHAYPTLDAALDDNLDVIDIATPASTHVSLVRRSIARAHVFVEKPLALTVEECAGLYALARRHSRVLGVGHIFRFNRAVSAVRRIVAAGAPPHLIRLDLTGRSSSPGDAGAIITFLHVFDVLDEIIGQAPREIIPLSRDMEDGRFERYALMALRYQGGPGALVEVGWIGGAKRRVLEVSFEARMVRVDLVRQTVEVFRAGQRPERKRHFAGEPLRLEIEHFLGALRGRHAPRPTQVQVLALMRVVRDAQKAIRTGRPVRRRG